MNKIQLIGYAGADATITKSNNSEFATFSLAVDESYKNKEGTKVEQTTWFNCIINDVKHGTIPYIKKGTQLFIEGRLRAKTYTAKNGSTAIDLTVNTNYIQLLGSAKKDEPAQTNTNTSTTDTSAGGGGDDLPF